MMMLATTIIPFQNEKKSNICTIHSRYYMYHVWFVVRNLLSWEDFSILLTLWTCFSSVLCTKNTYQGR
jgi:hypothetical protein